MLFVRFMKRPRKKKEKADKLQVWLRHQQQEQFMNQRNPTQFLVPLSAPTPVLPAHYKVGECCITLSITLLK